MWHITHASSLSLYSMISSDANCESLGLGFLLGTGSLGGLLARLRLGRGRHRLDAFVAFPGQRLPFQSGDVSVIRVLFPLQLTKKLCKSLPIHLPHHRGLGSGGGAEVGLELLIAGAGELHHAIADHTRDDAAQCREGEEEGLRVTRPPHQPPPPSALLPQDRHLSPVATAATFPPDAPLRLSAWRFLPFSPTVLGSVWIVGRSGSGWFDQL